MASNGAAGEVGALEPEKVDMESETSSGLHTVMGELYVYGDVEGCDWEGDKNVEGSNAKPVVPAKRLSNAERFASLVSSASMSWARRAASCSTFACEDWEASACDLKRWRSRSWEAMDAYSAGRLVRLRRERS